ncbi:hypothetical protein O181_060816, partial [Austropuccinia psidii MF-1]|nr:hypothetical protein [Austropuccinia psidii MF-1]
EETQIHFFIAKGSVHTVLGRPFLADNTIRLEFSHKQGEILSYQEPDVRRLCIPICKPQALGWQTDPPRGMDLCNMAKLARNTPGERYQNAKRDNTIINLTQKTQELSISPKSDEFGQDLQNKKWPDNLKRQLDDSTSEEESPSIAYKPIDNNEETFQILKVRFSEHHELSDEEIINEIEKDFKIIEERGKNLKETYHINFLDRPLNNQEEPYEWQLENPKFIQQPPNEDEETKSNLENEYNYLCLPYITFEDIYGDEAQESLCENKYLCQLPEANLNKIQLTEPLTEEGIKGNLSNKFWDKTFSMGVLPRRGLYFSQIWAQWYLGLNGSTYQTGRLKWVEEEYIFIDEDLW